MLNNNVKLATSSSNLQQQRATSYMQHATASSVRQLITTPLYILNQTHLSVSKCNNNHRRRETTTAATSTTTSTTDCLGRLLSWAEKNRFEEETPFID